MRASRKAREDDGTNMLREYLANLAGLPASYLFGHMDDLQIICGLALLAIYALGNLTVLAWVAASYRQSRMTPAYRLATIRRGNRGRR